MVLSLLLLPSLFGDDECLEVECMAEKFKGPARGEMLDITVEGAAKEAQTPIHS